METQFWLEKWQNGQIGFHRESPLPLLMKHWPALDLQQESRVLVPLCGKSTDMTWLMQQGHHVLGVELSPLAIDIFFKENNLEPNQHISSLGTHYTADHIEIIQGNILDLSTETLASVDAIYDRAAMVALTASQRQQYLQTIYNQLPSGTRGLIVTLEYNQQEMDGPPFSVDASILDTSLDASWQWQRLEQRDILANEPKFKERGLTAFHTSVYQLIRK